MQNVFHRNRFRLYVSENNPFDSKPEQLVWSQMKNSLNYLFIRLTDVIFRNKHRELQLLLKLKNGDVRL